MCSVHPAAGCRPPCSAAFKEGPERHKTPQPCTAGLLLLSGILSASTSWPTTSSASQDRNNTLSIRHLQVISQPAEHPEAHAVLEGIRSEYCVRITGTLCKRRDPNTRIPTGMVELSAEHVSVLNAVTARLPFLPSDEKTPLSEEVRLRHRVLDLR